MSSSSSISFVFPGACAHYFLGTVKEYSLNVMSNRYEPGEITLSCGSGTVSMIKYRYGDDLAIIIAPAGASSVTLTFSRFDTDAEKETAAEVYVSECRDRSCNHGTRLLEATSGNTVPASITSSTGILLVQFYVWTDSSHSGTISPHRGWLGTWTSL